jgi:YrbI family 3-deoxy-D-manno-octulosonate 8-phosphate phosphatase
MDTVAFIPVRGGSKSIHSKNIRPLAGRPLVHWTMSAALGCDRIDRLYVASEAAHIRDVAGQVQHDKLHVIDRSPETATDTATTESALLEFAASHAFDVVVLIQATSPLLSSRDLTGALQQFETEGADSLLSVVREHRFIWRPAAEGAVAPFNYTPDARPRRQDWDGELFENGAFYITRRVALLESGCRLSGRTLAYEMSPRTGLELDEPHDWEVAKRRLSETRTVSTEMSEQCRRLKMLVTDVDGVLTDSGVYVGADGELCKKFSTRDGMGIALWRRAGLDVAIMTSEDSPIVTQRAAKLKIERVYKGIADKGEALKQLMAQEELSPEAVLFIGDDINDLPAFKRAGFTACPSDASSEIKAVAHYICSAKGGDGAVREVIDLVLRHR